MSIFYGIQGLQNGPSSFYCARNLTPSFDFSGYRGSSPFVFQSASTIPAHQMTLAPSKTPFSGREFVKLRGGSIKAKLAKRRREAPQLRESSKPESVHLWPRLDFGSSEPNYTRPTESSLLKMRSKEGEYQWEKVEDLLRPSSRMPAASGTGRVSVFTVKAWSAEETWQRARVMLEPEVLLAIGAIRRIEKQDEVVSTKGTGTKEGLRRGVSTKTALMVLATSQEMKIASGHLQLVYQKPSDEPDLDETLPLEPQKGQEE